jgi:hypothetical protein
LGANGVPSFGMLERQRVGEEGVPLAGVLLVGMGIGDVAELDAQARGVLELTGGGDAGAELPAFLCAPGPHQQRVSLPPVTPSRLDWRVRGESWAKPLRFKVEIWRALTVRLRVDWPLPAER